MIGEDDCGEIGEKKIGMGKPKYSEKNLASAPLCPPQSYMARPEFEPGPPRWEASDEPLELLRGLLGRVFSEFLHFPALVVLYSILTL
jgi:hypothetical protein